jgi:hypothetical protein
MPVGRPSGAELADCLAGDRGRRFGWLLGGAPAVPFLRRTAINFAGSNMYSAMGKWAMAASDRRLPAAGKKSSKNAAI